MLVLYYEKNTSEIKNFITADALINWKYMCSKKLEIYNHICIVWKFTFFVVKSGTEMVVVQESWPLTKINSVPYAYYIENVIPFMLLCSILMSMSVSSCAYSSYRIEDFRRAISINLLVSVIDLMTHARFLQFIRNIGCSITINLFFSMINLYGIFL